ncbi:SDR family oxidoreductase [Novosphingobium tardum]|uniref:SDR family oxidoreductase n=1 Tax=Novosphingobium tardum TaxID=1538021 RepID=A0ABV8RP30_9SPHN
MVDETACQAIFITGAASGIGRAVARYFAARGWCVGLADVNAAGLAETAEMLPGKASSIHILDVRDREAWDVALADFARFSKGRLDVLFNNAGIAHGGPLMDNTPAQIDDLIDINFKGVVNGARAAFPYLRDTPGSCLLNTASAAALYGSAGFAVYSATKFAVRAMTEALEIEWLDANDSGGIKVRSLMPGFIDTPLLDGPSGNHTNISKRERVIEAGLEFTPLEEVAQCAWDAVHRRKLHTLVGKTARQLGFAARWMPGRIRKRARGVMGAGRQG